MENIIYRVLDKKGKYQQSYSARLEDSYSWAVSCAETTKGEIYEARLNKKGETESSTKIFPPENNEN